MADNTSNTNDNEASRLDQILKVQASLAATDFDLNEFMDMVVDKMQALTPATGVVIELAEGNEMVYRAASGTVKDYLGLRLPIEGSITGLCVTSKKVLLSEDTEKDARVNLEACRKVKARSLVVAPLFHNGDAVGVLKIMSEKPNAFTETDIKLLQVMTGFLGSALANHMLKEIRDFF